MSAEPRDEQAGGPADDRPDLMHEIVLAADVSSEGEEHEGHGEQEADAQGQQERPAVLLEGGPVALDPVDPVDRALHLSERGRPGHDRPDQTERQRQEAVVRPDLPRLLHGVREDLAGEARHGVLDRVDDHAADLEVAERGGEPDERDQPLHEDERHHEGERAGVAEAVGVAKPRERVARRGASARCRAASCGRRRPSAPTSRGRVSRCSRRHRDADLDRARLDLDLERLRPSRGRRRRARRAPSGSSFTSIFRARVIWTNGDFAVVPTAVRAIVRAHCIGLSAVTTPSSSMPSSGRASSNASIPPNRLPTLPTRMQLVLSSNHVLPSTRIFALNGFAAMFRAPVHT